MSTKTYQVKDENGNVVDEFDSEAEGPFTVVEKPVGGAGGGGPGSTED